MAWRMRYTAFMGCALLLVFVATRAILFWACRLPPDLVATDLVWSALAAWVLRGEWENSIWRH